MIPGFSACRHLSHHYFSYFSANLYACIDPAYFVKNFPCWLLFSGKPHRSALIVYYNVS